VALVEFVETKHPISGFTGTATELHKALKLHVRRQFGNPDLAQHNSGHRVARTSRAAIVAQQRICRRLSAFPASV